MTNQTIKIKEAKEVWEKIKDNEFILIYYPNFESYWKECQRINNLPENEWKKLMDENQKKLKIINKQRKNNK